MKKLIGVIAILVGIVLYYTVSDPTGADRNQTDVAQVGLLQLVSHPSLDQISQGVLDSLEEAGYVEGETMTLDFQNAQGDQNNLNTMSSRFVSNDADVMIGIATPAVQALANSSETTPIVMGAVTDPINAGLVDDLENPGGNITGVRDVTPYEDQIDLIKEMVPDIERLGIIYSTGEVNSMKQSEEAEAYAQSQGIEVDMATITTTNDLQQVAQNLMGQVDAIWVGTDNNVASAFPTLIEVANDHQVPVFPAVAEMVEEGGLATVGLDQYQLGVITGQMTAEILDGANPGELSVRDPRETEFILNLDQAEALNFDLTDQMIDQADHLIEEDDQ